VIAAPMPGVILEVHVGAGEPVTRGDPLCVLEAMKMRNTIRAPRDGVVTAVHVEAGRPVLPGEALVTVADPPR
jgi:3-methylcrotonyl-CoA carboxylase alpha subunit